MLASFQPKLLLHNPNIMADALPTGSKADIPQDLLNEVKRLEDLFTVDTQLLKKITDHFISELAKGSLLQFA